MSSESSDSSTAVTRPWGIWLTVTATLVLTLFCATIVWYGFVVTPETNCIIVVAANSEMAGDEVEVTPKVAPDPDHARLTVTLSEDNQYSARFFLTSGTYTVKVTRPDSPPGTPPVMDVTEFIPPGRRWTYDLNRLKAGTGLTPTTRSISLR